MPTSRRSRLIRRILLLLVLAGVAGGYAWMTRPWEEKPVAVTLETVTPGPAREVLAVNGQIVPGEKADLGAPVPGQLTEVLVREGDRVTTGTVLARLDQTIAEAALAQAEASLQSATIDAAAAKSAFDRAEALSGTVSAQARDSARFTFEAAEARVRQLAAAVTQAKQQLALYQVRAPLDGTVLSVAAEPGQVVGTMTTLFSVGDLARSLVETDVDEVYGARMKLGLHALVAPVGSREPMPATVVFVAPTVNPETGGRTIRLGFDAPLEDPLPSGLTMSVNIEVDTFDNAITVPRSAVGDLEGAPFVTLVRDERARRVPVDLRHWPSERLIVTSGLAAGDRLITAPQGLAEGTLVVSAPAE